MITGMFLCCLAFGIIGAIRIDSNGVIKSVAEDAAPEMPGGKTVRNLTKFDDYNTVARLAQVAIKDMDAKSPDTAEHFLIRVKEAARQVVAGVLHEIVFYFGECQPGTKTEGVDHAWIVRPICQEKADGKYGVCSAQVFEQPWTNTTELSEVHRPYVCKNVPKTEATAV